MIHVSKNTQAMVIKRRKNLVHYISVFLFAYIAIARLSSDSLFFLCLALDI